MQTDTERTTWISPELDFEELYRDGRYEEMIQISEENAHMLISLCRRSERQALEKSVRFGTVVLSYFARSLQETLEKNALFSVGKLMGHLEALDKLQFASDQDQAAIERAKLFGTKHLNEVILALETHGTMSQTELIEALKLQASTLSEVLKKVRKTNLVQVSPYGKYKVYSLTEEGVHYGAALRKKKKQLSGLEITLDILRPNLKEYTDTAIIENDAALYSKKPQQDGISETVKALQSFLENPATRKEFVEKVREMLPEDLGIIISPKKSFYICDYDYDQCTITKFDVKKTMKETRNAEASLFGTSSERIAIAKPNFNLSNNLVQNKKVSAL